MSDDLDATAKQLDRDHVFRFANRYYLEWFGLSPDEVVGRHARDVIGEENYAQRRALMDRALAGETIVSDSSIQHGDGSWRRADVRYRPAPGEKPEFATTLNGSGLGLARTFAAVVETYQQADGSIALPPALAEYAGTDRIGP